MERLRSGPAWAGRGRRDLEETKQLLREGIELHIGEMREDGLPIPERIHTGDAHGDSGLI